ncbi:MAG: hypothetical protein ACOYCD_08165 [Kiritimatiellia bacterium]|jgi:spermidine synthase
MFCAGMFAMLAQLAVLRELLVVFYGNEITVGLSLAAWLLLTGAGSGLFGLAQRRCDARRVAWFVTLTPVWSALIVPVGVFFIRAAPWLLRIPFGEQASLGWMLVFIAATLAPLCLPVGALFPAICRLSDLRRHEPAGCAAGRIYAADALGGICAGGLFYAALVNLPGGLAPAFWAGACGLAGAWLTAPQTWARRLCLGLLCLFCLFGMNYRLLAPLEWEAIQLRWHSFGVLDTQNGDSQTTRLLASVDSRYRNLALFESAGQKILYSNGQVAFTFPDPITAEFKIHFIMAQMPDARRVLLLGGNPPDDVAELLKYPLERLVCLEQDRAQTVLLQRFNQADDGATDSRVSFVAADGPRFIRECSEQFDVIIIGAPEPDTIAANRFYTAEFYRAVQRVLAPGGFMYTALPTSEHLRGEALRLIASVEAALRLVFPQVLVTPGVVSHFFAGGPGSSITLDAGELFRRAEAAAIDHTFFTPAWLLDAEELAPDKVARVRNLLAADTVPANTALRPTSTLMVLVRQLQIGGSPMQNFNKWLQRINLRLVVAILCFGGGLIWILALVMSRHPGGCRRSVLNGLLGYVVLTTGFAEMALEITLVFVFQNAFGNIYTGLAMIMAVFMAGLAAGSLWSARILAEAAPVGGMEIAAVPNRVWHVALAAELGLLAVACLVTPAMCRLLNVSDLAAGTAGIVYLLIGITGLATGAQFPAACRLWRTHRSAADSTPWINVLKLAGAALGGAAPGILLLPFFGLADTMLLVAAVKVTGVCCLSSAWRLARYT